MKKKILSVAFVAAIAIVGGLSFNQNKINVSDLALNNIEALAWEEGSEGLWACFRFSYDNPNSDYFFTYTRCMDCYVSTAVSVWQQEKCWHY